MRVLVFGGRDYTDVSNIEYILDSYNRIFTIDVIIEGNAPGVDRIAGYWARKNKIDNVKFPAKWDEYGKAAGPIRNQQMIDEGNIDFAIAFPGGKGTADMLNRIKKANIRHIEIED